MADFKGRHPREANAKTLGWSTYAEALEQERVAGAAAAIPTAAEPKPKPSDGNGKFTDYVHPLLPPTLQDSTWVARKQLEEYVRILGEKIMNGFFNLDAKSAVVFTLPKLHLPGVYQEKPVKDVYADFMHFLFFNYPGCLFYRSATTGSFVKFTTPKMVDDALEDRNITSFGLDLTCGFELCCLKPL